MKANGKLLEMHARHLVGGPDAWRVFNFDTVRMDGRIVAFELTGAVVPEVPRGAFMGRASWFGRDRRTEATVIIALAEHEAWVAYWEGRTGLCRACVGSGWEVASCSLGTYSECSACSGSGKCAGRAA